MIRPEWLRIAMIVGWTIVLLVALAALARAKEGGDWTCETVGKCDAENGKTILP